MVTASLLGSSVRVSGEEAVVLLNRPMIGCDSFDDGRLGRRWPAVRVVGSRGKVRTL